MRRMDLEEILHSHYDRWTVIEKLGEVVIKIPESKENLVNKTCPLTLRHNKFIYCVMAKKTSGVHVEFKPLWVFSNRMKKKKWKNKMDRFWVFTKGPKF